MPYDDGPDDERCSACGRLDPINCPCPPDVLDLDELLGVIADLYAGARDQHWAEATVLAENASGLRGPEARDAVDRDAFLAHLKELFS